mmetsp:Transcript_17655/g.16993  ORF Transcript_17655/g.16993 Transcript_17655/m.16993 type:complete len:108 (+) Transcript_17655:92-415(+)
MDSSSFARELNKYKIVRLADYKNSRYKTQKKSDNKPKLLLAPSTVTTIKAADSDKKQDFWGQLESINANTLSETDMKKFIGAVKEEHPSMVSAINLHDLEHIAKLLQ